VIDMWWLWIGASLAQDGWSPPVEPITLRAAWPRRATLIGRATSESIEHKRDGSVVQVNIAGDYELRSVKATGEWDVVLESVTLPGSTYEQRVNGALQPVSPMMAELLRATAKLPTRVGFELESGRVQGIVTADLERMAAESRSMLLAAARGDATGEDADRRAAVATTVSDQMLSPAVLAAKIAAEYELLLSPWAGGTFGPAPVGGVFELPSTTTGRPTAYALTYAVDAIGPCPGAPELRCARLRAEQWATPEGIAALVLDMRDTVAKLALGEEVAAIASTFEADPAGSRFGKQTILVTAIDSLRPFELFVYEEYKIQLTSGVTIKDEQSTSRTIFSPPP
jgi:hypothetical protein